jgi:hypothetical protein
MGQFDWHFVLRFGVGESGVLIDRLPSGFTLAAATVMLGSRRATAKPESWALFTRAAPAGQCVLKSSGGRTRYTAETGGRRIALRSVRIALPSRDGGEGEGGEDGGEVGREV